MEWGEGVVGLGSGVHLVAGAVSEGIHKAAGQARLMYAVDVEFDVPLFTENLVLDRNGTHTSEPSWQAGLSAVHDAGLGSGLRSCGAKLLPITKLELS